ncbi:arylesterase [Pedobacter boryungensis]|uniref:Arylesterase n=1 Tax=Pedobacter boryungensis TaxID=869962 RepID=A0ABX2DCN8_9SPHI|nr:arylesterase [Pedobacter boryungensis]NQX31086.1 arylesterase [Pedobacter boryungensis]
MKHVLFFGDSLTAGYGLKSPSTESFPALLAKKAVEEDHAFSYTNAGISGDTSATALQRLPGILKRNFDIFVLGIGANDILRGYTPQSMNANMEAIIQKIRINDHNTKIILLGMELPAWISHDRVSAYRDSYKNLAKKYELTFLPFLLEGVIGNRLLNLPDLVHPNAAGYKIIAQNVWPLLKSQL